jgi:glutamate-1-semialdehyde 2,1-aminomutase
MFGIYFTKNNIDNYEDIAKSNLGEFISFFKFMKKNGIFFAPSPFEAGFISSSHSKKDLTKTINTFKNWIDNK